jgi:hypothetical protein
VSGRFAYDFRTELHFADDGVMLNLYRQKFWYLHQIEYETPLKLYAYLYLQFCFFSSSLTSIDWNIPYSWSHYVSQNVHVFHQ